MYLYPSITSQKRKKKQHFYFLSLKHSKGKIQKVMIGQHEFKDQTKLLLFHNKKIWECPSQ